jgi:acyl-coenzyme A thioesterase PaaI-like protein
VHAALPAGKDHTTLTLEIKCVKGMSDQSGPVIAEGRAVQLGGRQATAGGWLRGDDGTLYAHGTSTSMVIGRCWR